MSLVAQTAHLLAFVVYQTFVALVGLPIIIIQNFFLQLGSSSESDQPSSVVFYEGKVYHARKEPKAHSFKYCVRTAYVNLDTPPRWFKAQSQDHMTSDQARSYAGTDGPVWLLTNPNALGYVINPISVYYCHTKQGQLSKCIAEVTNTPWEERVTFVFLPQSRDLIKKPLHVSPLMDMTSTWHLDAPPPGPTLKLVVRVANPAYGEFFHAELVAKRCVGPYVHSRNEESGFKTLWLYGLQPQRIALWIYWQALVLLWKGVPMYFSPPFSVLQEASKGALHPVNQISNCPFTWRPAKGWPWDTWGRAGKEACK